MARRRRLAARGVAHHVIRRGNGRKPIFFSDDDRILCLNWHWGAITPNGALPHAHVPKTVERALTWPRILQPLGRRFAFLARFGVRVVSRGVPRY